MRKPAHESRKRAAPNRKNVDGVWQTKYGPRRVRREAPTLAEAIEVARALSDEVQAQVEIASSLMQVSPEQVLAELSKPVPRMSLNVKTMSFTNRDGAPRAVVVERKPSRRLAASNRAERVRMFGSAR
jgi:hypothetical protein